MINTPPLITLITVSSEILFLYKRTILRSSTILGSLFSKIRWPSRANSINSTTRRRLITRSKISFRSSPSSLSKLQTYVPKFLKFIWFLKRLRRTSIVKFKRESSETCLTVSKRSDISTMALFMACRSCSNSEFLSRISSPKIYISKPTVSNNRELSSWSIRRFSMRLASFKP